MEYGKTGCLNFQVPLSAISKMVSATNVGDVGVFKEAAKSPANLFECG